MRSLPSPYARLLAIGPYAAAARVFRRAVGRLQPEQMLFAAVIQQAIADLGDKGEHISARRFLESDGLSTYADAIEIHPDGIRRLVAVADCAATNWHRAVSDAARMT